MRPETTWRLGTVVLAACMCLTTSCGDDNSDAETALFEPFAEASIVRVLHLAPSAGALSLHLERPSLEPTTSEATGALVGGPPQARLLDTTPLVFTAYTPWFYYASQPVSVLEFLDGEDIQYAADLAQMEMGKPYLAVLAESGGAVDVVQAPLWSFPAQPDGKAQVAILLATSGLGRLDVSLRAGGATVASWEGVAFGELKLHEPQALDPGNYVLTIHDQSGAELQALIPRQLDLAPNTYVQLVIAPPGGPGEVPRLVILVDGPNGYGVFPN